jgi:hypothetical protein
MSLESGHAEHEGEHCSPASAAGRLEPYGARVWLRPRTHPLETAPFLTALLEGIALSSVEAGAKLIGHLKCVLHTAGGLLLCNLTSLRSGAACRGDGARVVTPGDTAELDLVVLVYGLAAEVVDGLVCDALEGLLAPLGTAWDPHVSMHSEDA